MRAFGLKRLRGAGCNTSSIKRKVRGWRKLYDLSGDYRLKLLPRIKKEQIDE